MTTKKKIELLEETLSIQTNKYRDNSHANASKVLVFDMT
jgi:hypothetical protein